MSRIIPAGWVTMVLLWVAGCGCGAEQKREKSAGGEEKSDGPPDLPAGSGQRALPPLPEQPAPGDTVRPDYGAGLWYDADAEKLRREIQSYLAAAEKVELEGDLRALLVPHAGFRFSGPCAGWAYKQLEGRSYRRVILLGRRHATFRGVSIFQEGWYQTPLGPVPVEASAAKAMIAAAPEVIAFRPEQHWGQRTPRGTVAEHALANQLPFLQVALKDRFAIVPVLLGDDEVASQEAVAQALLKVADRHTLIVVSTDLSHFPPEAIACQADAAIIAATLTLEVEKLREKDRELLDRRWEGLECTMCGLEAVAALLRAAKPLGIKKATQLHYLNSGHLGDKSRVVGYAAVAFSGEAPREEFLAVGEARQAEALSLEAKRKLLQIARRSARRALQHLPTLPLNETDQELTQEAGAFVTLENPQHQDGKLRGCIGQVVGRGPLCQTVQEMAQAATRDSRFALDPVTLKELDEAIEIEISVMTPLVLSPDPLKELVLGRHGIVIRKGQRTGVYLPQVATEHQMSKEEFLASCAAHKAGIGREGWKTAQVYLFQALVFGEHELGKQH